MEQIILGDEPLMANCYKTLMPTPLSDDGVQYTLLQAHNSGVQFDHTQNLSSAVQFPRLQNSGSQLNHVQSRNSGAQTVQFDKPPPLLFGPLQTPLPNAGVQFTGPPPDQNLEVLSDPTRNPRYKTEICRNFKERARCIYGDQVPTHVLGFEFFEINLPFTSPRCIYDYLLHCPIILFIFFGSTYR